MIQNLSEAISYLESFKMSHSQNLPIGEFGHERCLYLMDLLDNPQDKIKIIHVAGTSGKGSTTTILSTLLCSHNLNVGLFQSPSLRGVLGFIKINNKPISEDVFVTFLNEITPTIEMIRGSVFKGVRYFEVITALAYWIFWRFELDFAVIETAMGGLLDCTNTVQSVDKIAVITRLGLDHQELLGHRLPEICFQKCGIIKHNNSIVVLFQGNESDQMIEWSAKKNHGQLHRVIPDESFIEVKVCHFGSIFDFHSRLFDLKSVFVSMVGTHQIENTAIALECLDVISEKYNIDFSEETIRHSLSHCNMEGRLETKLFNYIPILVDGAHNPQKMRALVTTLQNLYPYETFTVVLSLKKGKDIDNMIELMKPIVSKWVLTHFEDRSSSMSFATKVDVLKDTVLKFMPGADIVVCNELTDALQTLLEDENPNKLITGSLYLIADLYSNPN